MNKSDVIDLMAEVGLKAPVSGDFVFVSWDQLAALVQQAEKRWSTDMTTQTEAQRRADHLRSIGFLGEPEAERLAMLLRSQAGSLSNTVKYSTARKSADELDRLSAANAELLTALVKADEFIDGIREDLHHERVTDWYSEGASNAAQAMSESMRLIGNRCADFVVAGAAIAKHKGTS